MHHTFDTQGVTIPIEQEMLDERFSDLNAADEGQFRRSEMAADSASVLRSQTVNAYASDGKD